VLNTCCDAFNKNPTPFLAADISAKMTLVNAVAAEILNPVNILGKAEGIIT
jgi:hypothetical protein